MEAFIPWIIDVTNTGFIHSHFGRPEQTEDYSLRLKDALENCIDFLPEEDLVFFHHATFHIDICRFDLIAAAA